MGICSPSRQFEGMKTTKAQLACLLLCFAVNLINASDSIKDEVSVDKKSDADNFFAARGRRASDSSNGAASPDDFFWANRGKRSPGANQRIALRDQGSFNVPRPNGFFFPSAGKRASNSVNLPRPNGFFFQSAGKRGSSYNIPRPNGFFFPSAQGKRGLSRFLPKRSSFNLPRPNGFIFASKNQGKRSVHPSKRFSGEASAEDGFDESQLYGLLSNIFALQEGEQDNEIVKRDTLDESTFFAGRGKKSDDDLGAFYAGRGKKDSVDEDLAAFFAGRGKKGGEVGDIFFAGRG